MQHRNGIMFCSSQHWNDKFWSTDFPLQFQVFDIKLAEIRRLPSYDVNELKFNIIGSDKQERNIL